MNYKFKTNEISKEEFLKLNEENIMFITNPGRMGDEDGITFVIRNDNEFKAYRVSGWMYPREKDKDNVSLNDALNQFSKWKETWNNEDNENYQGKYKHLYLGFGNGLSIDNSIFNEYEPYLEEAIKVRMEEKNYSEEDKIKFKYSTIFNVWDEALINMAKDMNILIE